MNTIFLGREPEPILQLAADYRLANNRFAEFCRITDDDEKRDAFYDEIVGPVRDRLFATKEVITEEGARECLRVFLGEELMAGPDASLLRVALDWFDRRAA